MIQVAKHVVDLKHIVLLVMNNRSYLIIPVLINVKMVIMSLIKPVKNVLQVVLLVQMELHVIVAIIV